MISVACRGAGHVNVRRNRVTQSCHRTNVHVADQNGKKHALLAQSPSQHRRIPHLALTQLYGAIMLAYATSGRCDVAYAAESVTHTQGYVPSPVNIGWEVYLGAIAGVIPFIIGSYQFVARILIQRRCPKCEGSGLVERGTILRKCPECGGFFPWQGWKQFLTSTAAPGNGGVLRQPRNQDGVIYRVPPAKAKDEKHD